MSEICLKILLIGDTSVGKTALILKYIDKQFSENNMSTIGLEYKDKIIRIKEKKIKLQIWDTSGQERYRSITKSFYRNANALLFVFDVTNEISFNHIKDWLIESENSGKDFKKILVGNKIDLKDKRIIDKERMEQFAKRKNMKCFEVSAKEGKNVDLIFKEITKLILNNKTEDELIEEYSNRTVNSTILSVESHKSYNKKNCCK